MLLTGYTVFTVNLNKASRQTDNKKKYYKKDFPQWIVSPSQQCAPLRFTEVTTAHQIASLSEFHLLLENQLLILSYEFPKSFTISKIIDMDWALLLTC